MRFKLLEGAKMEGQTGSSSTAPAVNGEAKIAEESESKPPRRKRPKLTAELLSDPRGLDVLYSHFPKLPLRYPRMVAKHAAAAEEAATKAAEAAQAMAETESGLTLDEDENAPTVAGGSTAPAPPTPAQTDAAVTTDMRKLMLAYKDWAFRLYPHLAFEDFVERVAKMTGKTRGKIDQMRRFEIDRVTGATARAAETARREEEEEQAVMKANEAAVAATAANGGESGANEFDGPDDDELDAAMAAFAEPVAAVSSSSAAAAQSGGAEDSMSDLEGVDW